MAFADKPMSTVEQIGVKSPKFKISDLVILKSGGPMMVVSRVEKEIIDCDWFEDRTLIRDGFHEDELMKVN